jgi:hypothetical protein
MVFLINILLYSLFKVENKLNIYKMECKNP